MAQHFTMPRTFGRNGGTSKRRFASKTTSSIVPPSINSPVANPLLQLLTGPQSGYITATPTVATHYDVFLDEAIESPDNYRELIAILFNAEEGDSVNIYINSEGGELDTAIAIIEGLKHTQAHVTGVLTGACHSAASFISMYCHEMAVLDNAYSMVHTATFGSVGFTGNVKAHTDFTVRMVEKLINETYEGFLTKDEIAKVKSGVEMWFDADEIKRRMASRVKHLQALQKRQERETRSAE